MAKLDMNVFEEYKAAQVKVAAFFTALQVEINELPDNPDITRISNNCFTMSSKHLIDNSWSPKFYEFKHQYKMIAEVIDRAQTGNEFDRILKVLAGGLIITETKERVRLHPTVISNVNKMLQTIGIVQ